MINRIGQELGLNMNGIELVRANGQIRFLSKFFRNKNEILVHGAEICGEYIEDMKMAEEIAKDKNTARELFTFQFIENAIASVFLDNWVTIIEDLVRMVTFDALAGNNDRHFYNWGVINTKKITKKIPNFASIYDSARGLLWNLSNDNVVKHLENLKSGGKKIEKYINNACPRISIDENCDANHFELIEFLKKRDKDYKRIIDELSNKSYEDKIVRMIKSEFFRYFTPERTELIIYIIKERFNKVRGI